ncbi:MAG: type VI secretion system baseplate subunit TssK [Opitutus sp.]
MSSHIHWHEGLFLQPHHLQSLQRSVYEEGSSNRRLLRSYPAGVVEMRLSTDELANFRVRFERLVVIMESGLVVDFPDKADLPAFDLKPLFASAAASFDLYLAVPLWQSKRANSFAIGEAADARAKLLFKPVEATLADENTGENSKPILLRRYNARIIGPGDDRSDLEAVPLLRVMRAVGENLGQPKIDPEYVPPCIFLTGSPVLYRLVRDLTAQVQASRQELVVQVTRGGFNLDTLRGAQFEQILRLRTLNRFSARLGALIAAPGVAPFDWYLELRDLHAELAALHPDRDETGLPDYHHERLFPVFDELDQKIRGWLRGVVSASYAKLDFTREVGMFGATFDDDHFAKPVEYFLGVRSKLDPREVTRLVEDGDKFKFMPRSMATRAVRGVLLKEERIPPLQLPAHTGLTYFRVNRTESSRIWSQLQVEKSGVLRWPEADASDFEVTLYMTML